MYSTVSSSLEGPVEPYNPALSASRLQALEKSSSVTFMYPSSVTSMATFEGLTSRCTTPAACTAAVASSSPTHNSANLRGPSASNRNWRQALVGL